MTDTTNEPEQQPDQQLPDPGVVDPADFGPEAVDGWRPPGTETSTPGSDSQPGDPELEADPQDEPSS